MVLIRTLTVGLLTLGLFASLGGCVRQSAGTITVAKREFRKTEIAAKVVEQVNSSRLSPEDKSAAIAAIETTPTERDDTSQNRAILDNLILALKARGVDQTLLSDVTVASAKLMAMISADVRTSGKDGLAEADDPEIAFVLENLRQTGVSETLILQSLLNNLDPETLDTPDKLKSVMNTGALANFGSAAKASVFQDKLVAATAKNDQPVLSSPGETVAAPDSSTPNSNGPITVSLATATDTESQILGQGLSYVIVSAPLSGKLGSFPFNAVVGGDVAYVPDSTGPHAAYTDTFSYKICDAVTPPGCTAAVIVTVNVPEVTAPIVPVNQRPAVAVAGDTSKTTPQSAPVAVALATGSDPDTSSNGQSLSYLVTVAPSNGTLSAWSANAAVGGTVTYTPSNGYLGSDSFSYQICDNHGTPLCSSPTTVALSVLSTNSAPSDITLSGNSIAENSGADAQVGTLSSTDPDSSNAFSYALVTGAGDTDNSAFHINGASLRMTASADFETKSSYSVRIRSTDQGGLSFEKVFAIGITNTNESPGNISLSNALVFENSGGNFTVGALSTTDPDDADTFAYSLASGFGDTNNGAFYFSGSSLVLAASADFEAGASLALRVRSTDQGGLTFEKSFVITIVNVNDAPSDVSLSNATLAENAGTDGNVGILTATDQDSADTFTYSLVSGSGSTNNGSFNISGANLRMSASADFESQSSYTIRVRATDQGGLSFEKVFAIGITNVNETPTDIALSSSSLAENSGTNATVGNLTTADPDLGDTFAYTLVTGTGDTDNAAFDISSNTLRLKNSADFETKSSYSVRIQSRDLGGAGLSIAKTFTVAVTDLPEWKPEAYIKAANTEASDNFGSSVSLSGDTLAVAA